jgi:hypothetical protein
VSAAAAAAAAAGHNLVWLQHCKAVCCAMYDVAASELAAAELFG